MKQTIQKTIQKTIRRRRTEIGLTQRELAEGLGISYQAVSKWERGINLPDLLLLPRLCTLLGISTEELMGVPADSGDPPTTSPEEARKEL